MPKIAVECLQQRLKLGAFDRSVYRCMQDFAAPGVQAVFIGHCVGKSVPEQVYSYYQEYAAYSKTKQASEPPHVNNRCCCSGCCAKTPDKESFRVCIRKQRLAQTPTNNTNDNRSFRHFFGQPGLNDAFLDSQQLIPIRSAASGSIRGPIYLGGFEKGQWLLGQALTAEEHWKYPEEPEASFARFLVLSAHTQSWRTILCSVVRCNGSIDGR